MTTWKRTSALALAAVSFVAACTAGPSAPVPSPPSSVTPSVSSAAPARWRAHADAPTERLEVASAVVGGRLYLAGGLGGDVATLVESYDPVDDSWRREPPLPIGVHHAMGVAWRDSFVVLGGFGGASFGGATNRVFRLVEGAWRELEPMARARAAGVAAVVDGQIVVTAGQDGSALVAATELFDGQRWRDGAPIPTPRDHLGGAADGESVYAVGGRRRSIESVVPSLERYDVARDRWVALPRMPTARGGIGVAIVAGALVVAGGEGDPARDDGIFTEVEAYDLVDGTWRSMAAMRTARHGVGVGVFEERLYVAVGGPSLGGSVSAVLESLSIPGG